MTTTTKHEVQLSNEKIYRFTVVSTERGLAIQGTYRSDSRRSNKALQGIDNNDARYEAITQIHQAYRTAGVVINGSIRHEG